MANPEHVAKLKEGVDAWNKWREENPEVYIDLREADLRGATLERVDLHKANLAGAKLHKANLSGGDFRAADLHEANLAGAKLPRAILLEANLRRANLSGADCREANLTQAKLGRANLIGAKLVDTNLHVANLHGTRLHRAKLTRANLTRAKLTGADLTGSDLGGADLTGADLTQTSLVMTNFQNATLTDCKLFGISAWNVNLRGAVQSNLTITPRREATIQVDNLEVAQFVYLLLSNERIRHVIDTITSKVVLILGRFTPERKTVLDAIRDELRKRDYLPILFDFQKPESKDLTGTVTTLANMARFIIADLTDPSSVPHELATIAPGTVVPVQAIFLLGQREYSMFPDLKRRYHWVLEPYQYESEETLLANLNERVIAPAEAKVIELRQSRTA